MSNKNDGSAGDPKKPASETSGPKKPTPMLDLKATEVKDPKAEAAKPAGATGAASDKPADPKASTDKPDDKSKPAATTSVPPTRPSGATAAAASTSSASTPAAGAGKGPDQPGSPSQPAGGAKTAADPKPASAAKPDSAPKRSGGGIVSTLSHLAAGIIGGGLVLFGAQPIEQQLGVKLTPPAAIPADVSARLAAVEKAAAAKPTVDLSAIETRLAAMTSRIAEIDGLKSQVAALAAEQARLAKAPPASGGGSPDGGAVAERVARLEQTLKTLSSATAPDGSKNAIARLATISGKLSDLERTVANQLEALRKNVMAELEARVAKTAEASAAAQAGTERIDRELATVKTNAARLAQRAETLKAMDDRLAALVRAVQEQAAKLETELTGLKGDVLTQLKTVARPKDVSSALAPVSSKVTALDKRVSEIVEREATRQANARRIVLAIELGNLKRAIDRGAAFAAELDAVKQAAGDAIDLSALEKFRSAVVPTAAKLADDFKKVAFKMINAETTKADGSVIDRFMSGAKSIVRIRRTEFASTDNSTEAVVARIEKLAQSGQLIAALDQSKKLSPAARAAGKDWIGRLAARAEVDRAIAKLEQELKTSLGGTAAPGTKG